MCGRFILRDSNWAAYHDALSILQGCVGKHQPQYQTHAICQHGLYAQ